VPVALAEGDELAGGVDDGAPVVPKPVVDGAGFVEMATWDALLPLTEAEPLADADLVDLMEMPVTVVDRVADTAPMAKSALVANTALMSKMSTNVIL